METKGKKQTVNVVTLGCSKNIVDSEKLMGQIRAGKLEVSHDSNKPSDVVVINTCGFINDAKEESVETILKFVEAKQAGLVDKVIVMGCLTQRYRDEITNEIPEVDGIFGVDESEKILELLGIDYKKELVGERKLTTPNHYAYLKISEGCDHNCSFCAIPLIRGRHKSKPIEELVAEAKMLAKEGVKELILIAQDLTYYGVDVSRERKLGDLLKALVTVDGIEWIRLHYAYPTSFPLDVLMLMKEHSKICSYIDIPLQHVNDRILRSMRRGVNTKGTQRLIGMFREMVPEVAIRTTMIVGYPGETEEEFEELKTFVKASRFDRLGVFTYSPEENTTADLLEDDVPEDVKQRRSEEIMEIQQQISLEKNEAKIGKTMKVVIDREEGDYYVGRTEFDSPEVDNEVLISINGMDIELGGFYNVKITSASEYDLEAEIV
ncbi:MAG: 30S ribosomal protein S12 methylthiotransferase RimO [Bacteroidales bacterium]|nr:30S ribosomal protein S12 methylthiotransferase RimO [Bacteroidales bacterium]